MAYEHIGTTDYGTQTRSIGFYAPAESGVVNKRNLNIQERGIYAGGLITASGVGNQCTLNPLVCVIGDDAYQLRVSTQDPITVEPDATNTTIILRWAYTGSEATDNMDVLAVAPGDVGPNDLVVAVGTFTGGTLISIANYGDTTNPRTEAKVPELMLKVEETKDPAGPHIVSKPSMDVWVRAGRVNYGVDNKSIPTTKVSFTAPSSGKSRVDVIYADSDGAIKVYTGAESSGTPTVPVYNAKIALAEVSLTSATTAISQALIKDVRAGFVGGSATITGSQITDLTNVSSGAGALPMANIASQLKYRSLFWFVSYPAAATKVGVQYTMPFAGTITKAWLRVTTAPTVAALTVDIMKNLTSISTTKPTVAIGAYLGTKNSFDTTSFAIGDVITLDVLTPGTSTAGLTVQLDVTLT